MYKILVTYDRIWDFQFVSKVTILIIFLPSLKHNAPSHVMVLVSCSNLGLKLTSTNPINFILICLFYFPDSFDRFPIFSLLGGHSKWLWGWSKLHSSFFDFPQFRPIKDLPYGLVEASFFFLRFPSIWANQRLTLRVGRSFILPSSISLNLGQSKYQLINMLIKRHLVLICQSKGTLLTCLRSTPYLCSSIGYDFLFMSP